MQTFFSALQNARVLLKKKKPGFGLTQQTGTTPHTPRHSLWQTRINCRQHLRDSFHPLSEWKWDNESGPTDSVITGCGDPTTTSSFERERGGWEKGALPRNYPRGPAREKGRAEVWGRDRIPTSRVVGPFRGENTPPNPGPLQDPLRTRGKSPYRRSRATWPVGAGRRFLALPGPTLGGRQRPKAGKLSNNLNLNYYYYCLNSGINHFSS